MARLHHLISDQFNPPLFPLQNSKRIARRSQQPTVTVPSSPLSRIQASSADKHAVAQNLKRNSKKPSRASRPLIAISTSGWRWQERWSCDYLLSLRELRLADLAGEEDQNADVLISLSIQKHTGFGFSVNGRIVTSFKRKCSCCFSSYCKEIDTTFDVWVLPSSRDSGLQLPEIGESDQASSLNSPYLPLMS